jgi:hypothetical protein
MQDPFPRDRLERGHKSVRVPGMLNKSRIRNRRSNVYECARHRETGMISIPRKRCSHDNCRELGTHVERTNAPKEHLCETHAPPRLPEHCGETMCIVRTIGRFGRWGALLDMRPNTPGTHRSRKRVAGEGVVGLHRDEVLVSRQDAGWRRVRPLPTGLPFRLRVIFRGPRSRRTPTQHVLNFSLTNGTAHV